MIIIEVENLTKIYGQDPNLVKALDDVSLQIEAKSFISIVGQSGSGKTTLLNMLGGLDRPTSGKILYEGQDITGFKEDDLTIFRRRNIGFVFQSYNLVRMLSVRENICLPVELDKEKVDLDFFNRVTDVLGISDKVDMLPHQLSGGQQQRVAIARAIVSKPKIVLADEPTGNLDSKTSLEVMNLLKDIKSEFQQTIVMITHNEELADWADRKICFADGKVTKQ